MHPVLRIVGAHCLHKIGYYTVRRRIDARRGKRLLVLMYHEIVDDGATDTKYDDDSPTASEFLAHIEAVTRHFRVVSLADAVREFQSGGLRHDSVAVTFDDGYASVYRNALPALRRFSVPATLFVLTGLIAGQSFWWHRLHAVVTQAPHENFDLERLTGIVGVRSVAFHRATAVDRHFRRSVARAAENSLRDMEDAAREDAINRLRVALLGHAEEIPHGPAALSWAQIEEMVSHGIELGAHTVSHVNFRYADAATVSDEIVRSRDEISGHTRAPIAGFAFPYGKDLEHYQRYEDMLRSSGFDYACTAVSGNNRPLHNPYSLRRVTLPATQSPALIDHALCQAFVRDNSFYDMRPGTPHNRPDAETR